MRLSRSWRYLARSASGSKSIPDTVSFRSVEKSLILILLTGWVPTTFRYRSVIRPRLLNDRLAPFDTSDKSRSTGCAPPRSTLQLYCGERERREIWSIIAHGKGKSRESLDDGLYQIGGGAIRPSRGGYISSPANSLIPWALHTP